MLAGATHSRAARSFVELDCQSVTVFHLEKSLMSRFLVILLLSCLLGCSNQRYTLSEGDGSVMLVDQETGRVWMYASDGRFIPIAFGRQSGSGEGKQPLTPDS